MLQVLLIFCKEKVQHFFQSSVCLKRVFQYDCLDNRRIKSLQTLIDRDENTLVQKIIEGDLSSYRAFIEKYQKLVAHIGFRLIANPVDREDVCQEVFIKAFRNLAQFHFQSKI